ncbi:hypothetical protein F4825DRAFT_170513 [Nemania diffusa]|nr:hypothetical protein F4825DRAFT_170513 [Nemania diffusa]
MPRLLSRVVNQLKRPKTEPEGNNEERLDTGEASNMTTGDDIGPLEFQDNCGGPTSGFDLVFIHGLRGSRLKTWSRDGIFWPHDLLKDDLKNTRVITWGYDANIANAFQYASKESLFGHATTLLSDLARLRPGVTRPIIFICHSLGGLVVKQALITADSYNTHGRLPAGFGNIYKSTAGVIFMGTPHRGSSKESYGEIAVNIAKLSLRQPNSQLLRTLKPDSHILEQQRDDFTTISKDMAIVCIREELPTGAGLIVPEASATYDGFNVVRGAIHANHMDMVKFAEKVEGYKRTLGYIRDIINDKSPKPQEDQKKVKAWHKEILNALRFPGIFDREEMIEQAYAETCSWVWGSIPLKGRTTAERCEFIPWLRSTEPLLWISGKAGCGKSTLMKHIYHDPRTKFELENSSWAAGKDLIFIGHFFHDRGNDDQKSREGMLRSILFQVLDMQPHVTPIAFSKSRFVYSDHSGNLEYKLEMTKELLTWETLSNAFLSMLQHLDNFKICIFLDGLDEYRMAGREDQYTEQELDLIYDGTNEDEAWGRSRWITEGHKEVAKFLFKFSTHKNVKVCISSRELVVFEHEFRSLLRIRVHTHTAGAIAQYCTGRLTKEIPHLANIQNFIAEITDRSLGVFLWVQLVVDMLVDGNIKGDYEKELWAKLDKVPARLGGRDGLYMHMMRNIERQYLPESKRLFQLVMGPFQLAMRWSLNNLDIITLFLAEEGHLQDGSTEDLRAISDDYELDTWDEWEIRRDRLQKRLKSRCGGLLEGTRPVEFMHQTANQFFSRKYLWDEIFLHVDGFTSEVNMTLAMASGLIRRLKSCAEAVVVDDYESSRISDNWHLIYNFPDHIYAVIKFLNSVKLPHQMNDSPDGSENHAQRLLEELDHVGQQLTRAFMPSYRHFESGWPAAYYGIMHATSKQLTSFLDLMVVLGSEHYVEMKLRAQVSSGGDLARLLSIAALTRRFCFKGRHGLDNNISPSVRMIESLLKRGANPNAQDDSQDGFLRSSTTVWICLLKNIDWKSNICYLEEEIAAAKVFIKYGANPVARWDTGTPESVLMQGLDLAPEAKNDINEALELLRQSREKSVSQEIK